MSKAVEQLKRQLLEAADGQRAYAVLDGASIPGLLAQLVKTPPVEHVCLYRGELEPEIAEVAPYLVQLAPDNDFTEWLLSNGWGKHWGVLLLTRATLVEVRNHLRRLLTVHDQSGKAMLFRFYDPRVLKSFVVQCLPAELEQLFGPIEVYYAEKATDANAPAVALRWQNKRLRREELTGS